MMIVLRSPLTIIFLCATQSRRHATGEVLGILKRFKNQKSMFEEEINLRDYLHILRKYRWRIVSILFLIVVSVTILSFRQIPVYQATARILIEKETPNIVAFQEVLDLNTMTKDYYQTEYKILKSRTLAAQVIQKLTMTGQTMNTDSKPTFSIRRYLSELPVLLGLQAPPQPLTDSEQAAEQAEQSIKKILDMITITPIQESRLVDISVTSFNRGQTARIANTLSETYIEQNLENKLSASKEAVEWLKQELELTQQKVAGSEAALQQYKEEYAIISFEERQNIVMQKLSELSTAVNNAKIKRATVEAEYRHLKKYGADAQESIPQVINNPLIQELKVELANLDQELSQLKQSFRDKHPKVTALQSQIRSIRKRLEAEIGRILTSIKNKYEVARSQEQYLSKMLEEQKREALELNQKSIRYGELAREVESNQRLYNSLLQRMKETSVTERLQTNNIRIVDRAVVPRFPIAPRKMRNVALSIIFGFMLGITLAFFCEYLDNSIRSSDDITRYLNIPFLGFIPRISAKKSSSNGTKFTADTIVAIEPNSNASEAYRSLRTNVTFALLNDQYGGIDQGSVILVTSSGPAEGKSNIVSNLGIALAQSGSKTLIIDCDFRRPVMHKIFDVSNEKGFADMITNVEAYGSKIGLKLTKVNNLAVIPCGKIPSNPSELLGSSLTRALIEALSEKYDKILIDSPPVNTVTDPLLLSQFVDGIVFIIRSGSTKRDGAQHARDQLLKADAPLLGAVLNAIDLKKDSYYYNSYYYSHSYGQEQKREKKV